MMDMKQTVRNIRTTLQLVKLDATFDNLNAMLGCQQALSELEKEIPDNMVAIVTELAHLREFRKKAEEAGFRMGYPADGGAEGPARVHPDEKTRADRTVARALDRETVDKIENEEDAEK